MSSKSYTPFERALRIAMMILVVSLYAVLALAFANIVNGYTLNLSGVIIIALFIIIQFLYILERRSRVIGVDARTSTLLLISYMSMVSFVIAVSLFFMVTSLLARVVGMGFAPLLSYLIVFSTLLSVSAVGALLGFIMVDLAMPHIDRYFLKRGKSVSDEGGVRAFVFTGNRYAGFGFGSLLRGYAFVFTPTGELDSIGRGVLAHELGHARGKHTIILMLAFLLMLSDYIVVAYLHGPAFYLSILLAPFFMMLPLVIIRVCEVHADLAWYRMYGEESVNQLREVLRQFHGVDDPRKAPLNSRFTHPGKRDLVLRFGDALAPHAPWEFPLLAALFNAAVVDFYLLLRISSFLPLVGRFLTLILTLFYVGSFISSLVLVYLFGLVFKPLVRYFLAGSLIEDGLTNASLLLSSIYLATSAASLLLASLWWTAAIAAFVIALVIIRHYVGKLKPSLFTVLSTMVIYLAVNLVLLLIMHVTAPIALHWFESLWHVR
jgi:hypothetical protein